MFKVDEIVGVVRLKHSYDQYALMVLSGYVERQEAERKRTVSGKIRRSAATYKIKKEMPTPAEYEKLKQKRFTVTADELMDEAYNEISSLADEMRSWYDNLTDTLQQNDRGTRVGEVADTLEGISAQDSIELMSQVEVYHLPNLDSSSRAKRAAEVARMLQDVAAACHDYVSENRPEVKDEDAAVAVKDEEDSETSYEDSDYDELDSIADQCENDAQEVEGIEFVPMYG